MVMACVYRCYHNKWKVGKKTEIPSFIVTLPQKAVRNGRFIGRDVVKSRRAVSVEYNFQDGGNEREKEREDQDI